jgi:hypothetical protein
MGDTADIEAEGTALAPETALKAALEIEIRVDRVRDHARQPVREQERKAGRDFILAYQFFAVSFSRPMARRPQIHAGEMRRGNEIGMRKPVPGKPIPVARQIADISANVCGY